MHILGAVDVAEIDDHRAGHEVMQALKIERTELLPFGGDDECIGGFSTVISVLAIGNILQQSLVPDACRQDQTRVLGRPCPATQ